MRKLLFITLLLILPTVTYGQEKKIVDCKMELDYSAFYIITCGKIQVNIKRDWPQEWGLPFNGYTKYPAEIINGEIFPLPLDKNRKKELEDLLIMSFIISDTTRSGMGARTGSRY